VTPVVDVWRSLAWTTGIVLPSAAIAVTRFRMA
jgi:hypothetical protein